MVLGDTRCHAMYSIWASLLGCYENIDCVTCLYLTYNEILRLMALAFSDMMLLMHIFDCNWDGHTMIPNQEGNDSTPESGMKETL